MTMTRILRLFPLLPLLVVAGCSLLSPEARVNAKLVDAGLDPETAQCMAHKLVKHLDSSQLAELGRAMKTGGDRAHRDEAGTDHPGKLRLDEIGRRLASVDDPKIIAVTTRAGLSCAIMG
jgi:hypothetical protein